MKPIQSTWTTGEYIVARDISDDILIMQGTTVPTDATTGYAKGALFIDTDVATGLTGLYQNNGTNTSCVFQKVNSAAPWLIVYQETIAFDSFTDGWWAAGTLELGTSIPEGAIVVQSMIDAVTGFAWDTSAVLTIWDGTDVDRYNTGTPNVFATADHISAGAVSGTAYHAAAKTPVVTVTSNADFTSVTAWAATITIMYYQAV